MELIQGITGVILAGGKSSRFGSNKALARWKNKFLIEHITETMEAVFSDCLLSTNTPEKYPFLKMPMIKDIYRNMGPMAGIHATMRYSDNPWIFVIGCDMPAVTPELIFFLCSFADDDYAAIIPWLEDGPEPLCGLYHNTAFDKIETQLSNCISQVRKLFEKLPTRKVRKHELMKVTDIPEVFYNINKKQDMDNLLCANFRSLPTSMLALNCQDNFNS